MILFKRYLNWKKKSPSPKKLTSRRNKHPSKEKKILTSLKFLKNKKIKQSAKDFQAKEQNRKREAEWQERAKFNKLIEEELQNAIKLIEPSFLDKMFTQLEKKKDEHHTTDIPRNTVIKGNKTILIQKLEPRKLYDQPPIDGKDLWKKKEGTKVWSTHESCPFSFKNTNGFLILHIVGGCRGVSIQDKNVYRPHFSYAIVEKIDIKMKTIKGK